MTHEQVLKIIRGIDNTVLPSEAKELIEKAVKRQIATRPREREEYSVIHYYCPECGMYLGSRGKHSVILFEKLKYCPCGQLIDWAAVDNPKGNQYN